MADRHRLRDLDESSPLVRPARWKVSGEAVTEVILCREGTECAMPVKQNYSGRTFGRITLSAPVPGKTGYWTGACSCGNSVEKRIDNLKRPGEHSCGKCIFTTPTSDVNLEGRVRRLEEVVSLLKPQLPLPTTTVTDTRQFLTASPVSDLLKEIGGPVLRQRTSQFSKVSHDGEFWQTRSLAGKILYGADTEEEAAFAARVYLELTHNTVNRRLITDAELTLTEECREEIRHEVVESL